MEFKNLGNSGLLVSVIGVGCNNFGARASFEKATAVVHKALDLGINFFDTADIYGPRGVSEEYLGKALAGKRTSVVVATKFSGEMGDGPLMRGASRRYIMNAVEASLRRLLTDYIDLYQYHFPDPTTPIEETMQALDDLVHQGKVRYIGHSNFSGWQTAEAHYLAKLEHLTPFITAQNHYNLLEREIERELVPACRRFGLSVLPYFPLASGFLTGKYRRGEAHPAGARLTTNAAAQARIMTHRNWDLAEKLSALAVSHGHSLGELAIGWLTSQPFIGSVIAGATAPEQVEKNVKAGELRLTPEELAEIDALTKPASAAG